MSIMIFLWELTIVICRLPCHFWMAKAVSSNVELVNSVTSDSVYSFNSALWAFASNCFPIELFPCSDEWRRTWWQTTHMMPGLPVSSILKCKSNHYDGACLEWFQQRSHFEPTYIEALQSSKIICKVRSFKLWIMTCFFWEDIITSRNLVFKDYESDLAAGITTLGSLTRKNLESNDTVKQTAGS